jgi:hypothetical protein
MGEGWVSDSGRAADGPTPHIGEGPGAAVAAGRAVVVAGARERFVRDVEFVEIAFFRFRAPAVAG